MKKSNDERTQQEQERFSRRHVLAAGAAGFIPVVASPSLAETSQGPGSLLGRRPRRPPRAKSGCDVAEETFEVYNAKCFGAVADGATADDWAIQETIDAVPEVVLPPGLEGADFLPGTGEVYLPPGVYRVTKPIRLRHGMFFRGAGPEATILLHDHAGPCLVIEGNRDALMRHVAVQGLTITGRSIFPPAGLGIQMRWANDNALSDLRIRHVTGGVDLEHSVANRLTNLKISMGLASGSCLNVHDSSNANAVVGCRFTPLFTRGRFEQPNRGILITGPATGGAIVGCTFDSGDVGIELDPPDSQNAVLGTQIAGCHFESQPVSIKAGGNLVTGLSVTGNFFLSKRRAEIPVAIELDHCLGATISGNHFQLIFGGEKVGAAITMTEKSSHVSLISNAFTGFWDKPVEGPEPTSNHYYAEIMNGTGAHTHPFRISGQQFGFMELPVIGSVTRLGDEEKDKYGRLLITKNDTNGRKQLWVVLGDFPILLAEEGQPSPIPSAGA